MIIEIQGMIEKNNAGIKGLLGTVLRNERRGEIVYTPPEGEDEIRILLNMLEKYINEDNDDIDTLFKFAVIHYQFERIHPFYDGKKSLRIITSDIQCHLMALIQHLNHKTMKA